MRTSRIAGPGLVELPSPVHPAAHFEDLPAGVEGIISRIRVGLQVTLVSREHLLRPVATAILGEVIHHVAMIAISQGHPQSAHESTQHRVQHGHRGVVGLNDPRLENQPIHDLPDWL